MPQQVRGVVVDPAAPGKLSIKPVELRDPDRDEVAVRVTAISLNRGETRRAVQQAEPGWRPGWDFAGVAETAAADGSGPKPGTRVVGILPSGAWAERVNCRTHAVAALPDAVDDAEAATLPVAGLTALHALRQGGLLLGRKVLVDGASGGVGHLACQLAVAAGAQVWGRDRRPVEGLDLWRAYGVDGDGALRPVPQAEYQGAETGDEPEAIPFHDEELADWRTGRNAVYQLAALTIGARLAVADA